MNDTNSSDQSYLAVQAVAPGRLEVVQLPLAEPCFGTVRIRVQACGMCHTDTTIVEGNFPGVQFPRVPGHEVIGTIDAIGIGVEGWSVGKRVGVGFLGGHCGSCETCYRGDFAHCKQQPISGVHVDGGYAEFMIAHGNALVAIPDELSSVDAAPLLCAGLTAFNGLRRAKARPGDVVAIQGVGGLGHLGIQFARRMGFYTVAIDCGSTERTLAIELGAHHYLDSEADDVVSALQELGGARTIVATAPSYKSLSSLIGGLVSEGELIVAGVSEDGQMEINGLELILGERSIRGSLTGSPMDNADALRFSAFQGIRPMVETVRLTDAPVAYRRLLRNDARFRIVLVTGR